MDGEAYRFLLTGGLSLKEFYPDHPSLKLPKDVDSKWFSAKIWAEVARLSDLKNFIGLQDYFYDPVIFASFKRIYDSLTPHEEPLPS